jgi:enoyl-[acyl-carrier protein] reductase I
LILEGRKGVVLGVANKRSIAWSIAKSADRYGASLCLVAQNERFQRSVQDLKDELARPPVVLTCDVAEEAQMDRLAEDVRAQCGAVDFVVHCLAFARKDDLDGRFSWSRGARGAS